MSSFGNHKGFFFSFDAAMALILLVTLFTVFSIELSIPKPTSYLPKTSIDYLTVLDKLGFLTSLYDKTDQQAITSAQEYLASLPPNLGGNLTVKFYEYKTGFVLKKSISAVTGPPGSDKTSTKHVFADGEKGYFGMATLEVWHA